MPPKENLNDIRKGIDEVDEAITRLLEKRMDHVRDVAEYKRRTGMAILDSSREQQVLDRILSQVKNPEYRESIKAVYTEILKASREFQSKRIPRAPESGRAKYGLVGEKLSHSLSPAIHSLFFKELGIDAEYDLIEVKPEDLPELLEILKSHGYLGVNVTIPYKKEIIGYLDSLSDEALHIGAVNTICFADGYRGYNTDYDGFGMAFEEYDVKTEGSICAVLGSGGAARAVVAYLEDHGASGITIVSRDPDSAMMKFPGLSCADISGFRAHGYDILVNTTPVGMHPDVSRSPLGKEQIEGAGFIMDLVYNPAETVLLRYAEELNIPCANGLYMLAAQALRSEEIWQGRKLDKALIHKAIERIRRGT
ncbi:MAG TPA: chorismate mutase [Thermoclostridium sp.]|nr:chorismate mutase [Clostridiaceae bacterium]HOQ76126.1 chorismate mutase [Thermoclostridium sp.]